MEEIIWVTSDSARIVLAGLAVEMPSGKRYGNINDERLRDNERSYGAVT